VIEAQLLNVRIDSPIDGTVDKVTLNAGDLAQPGQTILSVNNLDSIWITANYEETKVGRIRPGARVLVSVDAYPDRAFEGKVELIHAGAQPSAFQVGDFTKTTQRVPVKIDLSSPLDGATLVPGMSVEVKVRTDAVLPAFAEKIHL
jgi:membrane fusion protein (multidrug efflux system)